VGAAIARAANASDVLEQVVVTDLDMRRSGRAIETMANHGCQAVAWQTAINPVVALEMLATGSWQGAGVLGPEAFDAVPFLDRLRDRGEPWHIDERVSRDV